MSELIPILQSWPHAGGATVAAEVLLLVGLAAWAAGSWLKVALPAIDWWQTRRTRWDQPRQRKQRSRRGGQS